MSAMSREQPAGDFSPVAAGEKVGVGGFGPGSNTGQKGGALVDYLTVVFPSEKLEEFRVTDLRLLLAHVFGFRDEVVNGGIRNKPWHFYRSSAVLLDRENEMVGRIGLDGNGDTVCVSLSGAGCRWVKDWAFVATRIERLKGRISRVDVAFDDYEGDCLDVHAMRERACQGEFAQGGRPPSHRFLSDEGHGTGSTLYVGGKGHKELCIYEKGKQLGLKDSPWVRCEVRLYGKHCELSADVLRSPLAYLLGAYDVLQTIIRGVCSRLKTVRKAVETTGEAMRRYLHRQVGPSLNLLVETFGVRWAEWVEEHVVREGHPGRFRGVAKGAALVQLMREQLCPA